MYLGTLKSAVSLGIIFEISYSITLRNSFFLIMGLRRLHCRSELRYVIAGFATMIIGGSGNIEGVDEEHAPL